jgi:hypothetical protein
MSERVNLPALSAEELDELHSALEERIVDLALVADAGADAEASARAHRHAEMCRSLDTAVLEARASIH